MYRNGPPRNGGKPNPNTAPTSPSRGERMMPSSRQRAASFSIAKYAARAGISSRRQLALRVSRARRASSAYTDLIDAALLALLHRTDRSPSSTFARAAGRDDRAAVDAGGASRSPNASYMIAPDFARDVEADFVDQRDRADRKSEIDERPVDRVDRHALVEQAPRLVDVRRENAVHEEARARRSPRSPSCPASCRTRPPSPSPRGASLGVTITSSSGILCTGEKKCIPSTRSGRVDAFGDARDRNRARVRREDRRRRQHASTSASTACFTRDPRTPPRSRDRRSRSRSSRSSRRRATS